eukprot:GEMP01011450.1.p1 GENE.GEMP01011450.1~~GEMP01011450.1.p1  ORF type:complete len:574 (+),score=125.15 GEMP01011450.1:220-1941(+)
MGVMTDSREGMLSGSTSMPVISPSTCMRGGDKAISRIEAICAKKLFLLMIQRSRIRGPEALLSSGPRAKLQFALERMRLGIKGRKKDRLNRISKALTAPIVFEPIDSVDQVPSFRQFLHAIFRRNTEEQIEWAYDFAEKWTNQCEEVKRDPTTPVPPEPMSLTVAMLVEEELIQENWAFGMLEELDYSWDTKIGREEFLKYLCPKTLTEIGAIAFDRVVEKKLRDEAHQEEQRLEYNRSALPPITKEGCLLRNIEDREKNISWLRWQQKVTESTLDEEENQKSQLEVQVAVCRLEQKRKLDTEALAAMELCVVQHEGAMDRLAPPPQETPALIPIHRAPSPSGASTPQASTAAEQPPSARRIRTPGSESDFSVLANSTQEQELQKTKSPKRRKGAFHTDDEDSTFLRQTIQKNDADIRRFKDYARLQKWALKGLMETRSPEQMFDNALFFSSYCHAFRCTHDENFNSFVVAMRSGKALNKTTTRLKNLQHQLEASWQGPTMAKESSSFAAWSYDTIETGLQEHYKKMIQVKESNRSTPEAIKNARRPNSKDIKINEAGGKTGSDKGEVFLTEC